MGGSFTQSALTFDAVTTALADMHRIVGPRLGDGLVPTGPQVARFLVTSAASGNGTLLAVLAKKGKAIDVVQGTVTATAFRDTTNVVSGSGRYICTVAWSTTNNNKLDLLGHVEGQMGIAGPGLDGQSEGASWLLGLSAIGTMSDVEVHVAITQVT